RRSYNAAAAANAAAANAAAAAAAATRTNGYLDGLNVCGTAAAAVTCLWSPDAEFPEVLQHLIGSLERRLAVRASYRRRGHGTCGGRRGRHQRPIGKVEWRGRARIGGSRTSARAAAVCGLAHRIQLPLRRRLLRRWLLR
ncbi:hypothetical protein Vafri_6224, partial [Volvox africanus]